MENKEIKVIAKYELAYRNKIYSAGDKITMLEKDVKGNYKNDVLIAQKETTKIKNKKSEKFSDTDIRKEKDQNSDKLEK